MTLQEKLALIHGDNCTKCEQWMQTYKRRVYKKIIQVMVSLLRISDSNPGREFFHIDEFIGDTRGVAFAIAAHFGLVTGLLKTPPTLTKRHLACGRSSKRAETFWLEKY